MVAILPGMHVTPNIRLVRELGGGGMGRVWLADHLALRSPVVVKFVSPEYAANEEALERFSREAAAASQVRSPHVVQTLDHGVTPDGVPYIVMEHLEGRDVRAALTQCTRLAVRDAAMIVSQIAKALGRAHQRGIVHRDIKPENIFLCDHGEEVFVKLLDFGIARGVVGSGLATASGMVIGTAPYMSPEQLMAEPLDARTDLWSLAVVAYEMLTGELPFPGATIAAVTLAIFQGKRPVPSCAHPPLGTAFDAWFARACAVDLEDRFGSAAELADAFAAATQDVVITELPSPRVSAPIVVEPVRVATVGATATTAFETRPRKSRRWLVVGAAAALALGGGLWLALRAPEGAPAPVAALPSMSSLSIAEPSASTPAPKTIASTSITVTASASTTPKPSKPKPIPTFKKPEKKNAPIF